VAIPAALLSLSEGYQLFEDFVSHFDQASQWSAVSKFIGPNGATPKPTQLTVPSQASVAIGLDSTISWTFIEDGQTVILDAAWNAVVHTVTVLRNNVQQIGGRISLRPIVQFVIPVLKAKVSFEIIYQDENNNRVAYRSDCTIVRS
jgi:hypothetical protein